MLNCDARPAIIDFALVRWDSSDQKRMASRKAERAFTLKLAIHVAEPSVFWLHGRV
jgi:hypothetical protein